MSFSLRHILAATLLHALLFALLAGGLQCSRPPSKPPVITAVIYDASKPAAVAPKRDRAAELEKLKQKLDEKKQKREEDRRKQDVVDKARREDERKRKLVEDKKLAEQKAVADRKSADDAKKKRELDDKREREESAKRDLQRQVEMEEELRREGLERDARREQDANASSAREAAMNAWRIALIDDIQRNWVKPLSAPDAFNCRLNVQLLPDGSVTSAKITATCGNAALDKSVADAVFRASPLPKPSDPAVFQRDLNITFEP